MADDHLRVLTLQTELSAYVKADGTVDVAGARGIIKTHYRRLAKDYHPDKTNGDTKKADYFKDFSSAWTSIENLPDNTLSENIKTFVSDTGSDDLLLGQALDTIDSLETRIANKDKDLADAQRTIIDLSRGKVPAGASASTIVYQDPSKGITITVGNAATEIPRYLRANADAEARLRTEYQRKNRDLEDRLHRTTTEAQLAQRNYTTTASQLTSEQRKNAQLRDEKLRAELELNEQIKTITAAAEAQIKRQQQEAATAKTRLEQAEATLLQRTKEYTAKNASLEEKAKKAEAQYQQRVASGLDNPLNDRLITQIKELRDSGSLDQALNYCTMILTVEPDHVPVLYYAGTITLSQKQYANSGRYLTQILSVSPKHSSAQLLLTRVNTIIDQAVQTARQDKKYDQVIALCEQRLQYEPTNNNAHYFTAAAYEALNDLSKAREHYQAAGKGTSASDGLARVDTKIKATKI